MSSRRSITSLYALLAAACAVVVVVTAVRATRCVKAASITRDASHEVSVQREAADDPPSGELSGEVPGQPVPAGPDGEVGQTCTSSYCTIPSHRHAEPLDPALTPDVLPAIDEAPPTRPPSTLERPPRP